MLSLFLQVGLIFGQLVMFTTGLIMLISEKNDSLTTGIVVFFMICPWPITLLILLISDTKNKIEIKENDIEIHK